jgi:hypothetical protein
MAYYDENGNAIEGILSPEETAQLKTELSTVKESLAKLENKEFNFKKLRDMSNEEREKLTVTELELKKRQESLEEEQRTWKQQVVESHKDDALAVLAGDNEELRKKILLNYNRLKDEAVTKEQVAKKMKEAYLLSKERHADEIDPLSQALVNGVPPKPKSSDRVSPELEDLAKKFGVSKEELTKK